MRSLKPSDTHCATGETCSSGKYCPKGNDYVDGRCVDKSGVSSGDLTSSGIFNDNKRERINHIVNTMSEETHKILCSPNMVSWIGQRMHVERMISFYESKYGIYIESSRIKILNQYKDALNTINNFVSIQGEDPYKLLECGRNRIVIVNCYPDKYSAELAPCNLNFIDPMTNCLFKCECGNYISIGIFGQKDQHRNRDY